ncbi:PfkB family carbohydrate kinase [uncultured Ferrimonas sp.]|uniref:PfkB family carbohydrate kinase n=1 Tax=uncultured Ferrimonas sp. TaxID=432640 RepID=UPI00262275D4|nr:PfkB family carbohydrate kinase [uncultured Ferrimonas sp.]
MPAERIAATASKAAKRIHALGINVVIIWFGVKEAFVSERNQTVKNLPTHAVNAIDTVAAGGTFNGAQASAPSQTGLERCSLAV